MKKSSLIVLSVLAMGLAGCGNKTTTPATTTAQPTVPVTTETPLPEVSIKDLTANKTVEVGNTLTVKVRVTTDAEETTVRFSSEDEGDLIELPTVVDHVNSIKITAVHTGEATIKATSIANPNVSIEIKITIIPKLKDLQTVWTNVISGTNYTLTSKDDSGNVHQVVKASGTAVTWEDGNGKGVVAYDETSKALGYGAQADGKVVALIQAANGDVSTSETVVRTENGLLTADDVLGLGEDASEFDIAYRYAQGAHPQFFFGLQMINPAWLSNEKDVSNEYEIAGSSTNFTAACAEMAIWQLVDYAGFSSFEPSGTKLDAAITSVAEAVTTTVTVVANDQVELSVKNGSKTYTATLSATGSTALDAKSTAALAASKADLPALPNDLNTMYTGIKAQTSPDYTINLFAMDNLGGGIYTYVTDKYVFKYYPEAAAGLFDGTLPDSFGYVKKDDGFYKFSYTINHTTTTAAEAVTEGLGLNYSAASVVRGEELTLTPTLTPANADAKYTWTSSNETVATVSDKGVVKALKLGTSTITVTSGDLTATAEITVIAPGKATLGAKANGSTATTTTADIIGNASDGLFGKVENYYKFTASSKGGYYSGDENIYDEAMQFFDMPTWAKSTASNELQIDVSLDKAGKFDAVAVNFVFEDVDEKTGAGTGKYLGVPCKLSNFGHTSSAVAADDVIRAL
jgi:uncharacterized protein YjdB